MKVKLSFLAIALILALAVTLWIVRPGSAPQYALTVDVYGDCGSVYVEWPEGSRTVVTGEMGVFGIADGTSVTLTAVHDDCCTFSGWTGDGTGDGNETTVEMLLDMLVAAHFVEKDTDGDGYGVCEGDCDDTNPEVNPGAEEVCNEIDDDCDGDVDEGFDQDRDGVADCVDNCPNTPNPGQEDSDGDGIGDPCDILPSPLSNLVAEASWNTAAEKSITLTWVDNSDNEEAFHIERTHSDTVFGPPSEPYSEIATAGADVITYLDAPLSNSTTYYYRVRARNAAGYSSYSNVASATTVAQLGITGPACFIATAASGADDSGVDTLRTFRDSHMVSDAVGSALVSTYYRLSPPVAQFIDDHPTLKPVVRVSLLPAVALSALALSTTLAQKIVTVASLALVSAALAVWASKRRGKGSQYS